MKRGSAIVAGAIAAFCAIAPSTASAVELDMSADRADTPFAPRLRRIGTLRPRSTKEIRSSNWMVGCECNDRDLVDFEKYKRFLPPLGVKTIRLMGGWQKCEQEKGVYDFSWLDREVDFANANGINVYLGLEYGNPIYPGGGGVDLAGRFPKGVDPVFICPAFVATAKSAMVVSSVSPLRWEMTTPYFASCAILIARNVSVSDPI